MVNSFNVSTTTQRYGRCKAAETMLCETTYLYIRISMFKTFTTKTTTTTEIDSVLEDKEFEKGILESNKFYEIKCSDADDEDAECTLELLPEFSGKVPSKKWLDSNKVSS